MKKIKQQFAHDPDGDIIGDCFRASVASIMEVDIDSVPHFVKEYGADWFGKFNEWLNDNFGLAYYETSMTEGSTEGWRDYLKEHYGGMHVLITGISPRYLDEYHCVVGNGLDVVWDPHPNPAPLVEIVSFGVFIKRL
jgi:hypothetical protein